MNEELIDNCAEDKYGNLMADLENGRMVNCCFPDCGCDGQRLCMAENGASENACRRNLEGMYSRTDKAAKEARIGIMMDIKEGKM